MTNANVLQLCQPGTFAYPLTEILRNGARALLAQAVEAEVAVCRHDEHHRCVPRKLRKHSFGM